MGHVKITNLTKKTICLNLETNDLGKGLMFENLAAGRSKIVDEEELSEQIHGLVLKRKSRDPALSLEAKESKPVEKLIEGSDVLDEDIFPCDLCERTFTTQYGLNTHVRSHEDEE